jgi:4-hydroxybenzoate polyprenyltransferase
VALSLFLPSLFFKASQPSLILFCLFAFISNFIRELVKDMEDMRGDRQHYCRTFPIAYGIPASRHLINGAGILLLLTLLAMVTESPLAGFFILILCAVPFAIFFFRIQKADKKKDFTRLSRILKWAMLAGIAGMMAF